MSATAAQTTYATVQPCFKGETIVCLGTGPSLTPEDVDYCRGRARVIAIKHAIALAPWADVLYAAGADDSKWWAREGANLWWYRGLRYTLDGSASSYAQVLRWTGFTGFDPDPGALRSGKNSGFQSIQIAVKLGAARVVLLGFDMDKDAKGREHYFGGHWHGKPVPLHAFVPLFDSLVEPLKALGVRVINASRQTALRCFPQMPLAEALA